MGESGAQERHGESGGSVKEKQKSKYITTLFDGHTDAGSDEIEAFTDAEAITKGEAWAKTGDWGKPGSVEMVITQGEREVFRGSITVA